MDRNLEALERMPPSTRTTVGLTLTGAIVIMLVSALLIRTCPSEDYRAGHDAVMAQGHEWVDAQVDAAAGTSLRACQELHRYTVNARTSDYSEFVEGCGDAIDSLSGRHVPMVADRG